MVAACEGIADADEWSTGVSDELGGDDRAGVGIEGEGMGYQGWVSERGRVAEQGAGKSECERE